METKYTKDKWICIEGTELRTSRVIIGDAHDIDLEINGENRLEEEVANALLISKAPEMIEFLIELYNDKETYSGMFPSQQQKLEQLIKEATEL